MPEFDQLAERLWADVSDLNWEDPARIRATGTRRQRLRIGGGLVIVIALSVAAGTGLQAVSAGRPSSPAATGSASGPTAPGSAAASSGSPAAGLPPSALLTAADIGPGYILLGSFPQPYSPNPFLGCQGDGLPGGAHPDASTSVSFSQGQDSQGQGQNQGGILVGYSILTLPAGDAHALLTALDQLIAGPCRPTFQVISRTLGGDESILLATSDPAAVQPEAAHGLGLYYAIIRRGRYVEWLTVIDQRATAGQATLAALIAQRADRRLCTVLGC